ncbi:Phosphoacetylglucosamine mutase [Neoconidiobolus thromboides FSU 785]|nr:Phosphoacetylglucosamine mutase [Neoconidiobolus thromboides FSU 785]
MAIDKTNFVTLAKNHPKSNIQYSYGTAGFRMKSELLDPVFFRVGLIAALRSRKLGGKTIGVMVTASHNPAQDNGVKVVDPLGEMLEQSWEAYVTKLANIADPDELLKYVEELSTELSIDNSTPAHVIIGRDTRPSGPKLIESLVHGLQAVGSEYKDEGVLTTPQLHYIVRCLNTANTPKPYGEPTEAGYYSKLSGAFKTLLKGRNPPSPLTVDCANGVGAPKLKKLAEEIGIKYLQINITNDDIDSQEKLNYQSGADYVKTTFKFPNQVQPDVKARYCALDGDADRVIYFYTDPTNHSLKLLDGDKISTLAAMFLIELVNAAGLGHLQVGVVQTAYANGSSTAYLKDTLKVPVACAKTGVKHLHHEAESFDIGVYFEANGHGTVLFGPSALSAIENHKTQSPAQAEALASLAAVLDLINQAVGDALSDMLLVEVILAHRNWSLSEWDTAYTDLPNRLAKVVVQDRNVFQTTDAERKLTHPAGLQEKIDQIVAKYNKGRSFVRPSGTEDVVRVYAEANTRQECDDLAIAISKLVYTEAGGKGDLPTSF